MRHKGTSEVDCGCRLADTPLIVGNSDNTGCGHRGMGWDFRPLALGHRLSSFIAPEMACGGPLYHSSRASPSVDGLRDQEQVLVAASARFPCLADFIQHFGCLRVLSGQPIPEPIVRFTRYYSLQSWHGMKACVHTIFQIP